MDGTQFLQEKDASTGGETVRYLLQNGAYDGLRAERKSSDNTWRFFAYDVQGSNRMLLNADGSAAGTALYRAFGERVAQSGLDSRFRYAAQYGYQRNDALTAYLLWVKARILDGKRGGWMSQDPIGFAGGDWNMQRYGFCNPIINIDPSGKAPWLAVACVLACGPALGMAGQCVDDALRYSGSFEQRFRSCWSDTMQGLSPAARLAVWPFTIGCIACAIAAAKCFIRVPKPPTKAPVLPCNPQRMAPSAGWRHTGGPIGGVDRLGCTDLCEMCLPPGRISATACEAVCRVMQRAGCDGLRRLSNQHTAFTTPSDIAKYLAIRAVMLGVGC